jgi:hypothetical protein
MTDLGSARYRGCATCPIIDCKAVGVECKAVQTAQDRYESRIFRDRTDCDEKSSRGNRAETILWGTFLDVEADFQSARCAADGKLETCQRAATSKETSPWGGTVTFHCDPSKVR